MQPTFAYIFKKIVTEHKLKLKSIATEVGVTTSYLSNLQSGKRTKPSTAILQKLTECLQRRRVSPKDIAILKESAISFQKQKKQDSEDILLVGLKNFSKSQNEIYSEKLVVNSSLGLWESLQKLEHYHKKQPSPIQGDNEPKQGNVQPTLYLEVDYSEFIDFICHCLHYLTSLPQKGKIFFSLDEYFFSVNNDKLGCFINAVRNVSPQWHLHLLLMQTPNYGLFFDFANQLVGTSNCTFYENIPTDGCFIIESFVGISYKFIQKDRCLLSMVTDQQVIQNTIESLEFNRVREPHQERENFLVQAKYPGLYDCEKELLHLNPDGEMPLPNRITKSIHFRQSIEKDITAIAQILQTLKPSDPTTENILTSLLNIVKKITADSQVHFAFVDAMEPFLGTCVLMQNALYVGKNKEISTQDMTMSKEDFLWSPVMRIPSLQRTLKKSFGDWWKTIDPVWRSDNNDGIQNIWKWIIVTIMRSLAEANVPLVTFLKFAGQIVGFNPDESEDRLWEILYRHEHKAKKNWTLVRCPPAPSMPAKEQPWQKHNLYIRQLFFMDFLSVASNEYHLIMSDGGIDHYLNTGWFGLNLEISEDARIKHLQNVCNLLSDATNEIKADIKVEILPNECCGDGCFPANIAIIADTDESTKEEAYHIFLEQNVEPYCRGFWLENVDRQVVQAIFDYIDNLSKDTIKEPKAVCKFLEQKIANFTSKRNIAPAKRSKHTR